MRERDWATLIWSLQHGNCIIFLGPDLPDDTPIGLAQVLGEQLFEGRAPSGWTLPALAQRFVAEFGRTDLEREIVRYYQAQSAQPSGVMDAVAKLPFYLIITSRHDDALSKALTAHGKAPSLFYYHFRGNTNDLYMPADRQAAPLVYSLHGSLSDPPSLVLTENDLLDFLVAVVSKNPPLPASIRSELQRRDKCYLFLGFGIRHWHLRILLHVLQLSQSENRSFALEPLLPRISPDIDQTILFYKTGYRIEILDLDVTPFLQELHERLALAGGTTVASSRTAWSGPAPKIFICHASEDRAVADELCRALEAAGFQPWVDTSGLEPGDDWDRLIESRIKDSDYFVVLQSRHLAAKPFSYVNKEIRLALNRQGFARPGTRYIIPLRLEGADLLEELRELQTLPMRDAADMQALISTLTRDSQRRLRRHGH